MPKTKRQSWPPAQQPLVMLYPTKASALNVAHPTHGPLKSEGSWWPKHDGFTYRMVRQRIATEDAALAYVKPKADAAAANPPVSDASNKIGGRPATSPPTGSSVGPHTDKP